MTAVRKSLFWRIGVASQLVVAMVLITLGSQSSAFHHWVHGEEVACSLAFHAPVDQASAEHPSDEPEHDATDPLDPFCRSGFLSQVVLLNPVIEQPRVAESLGSVTTEPLSAPVSPSAPARAPPVLI